MQHALDTQEQQITERKSRFTLYLGPEESEALEKRSADTGAPRAELIRRAVRAQYLQEQRA